MGFSMSLADSGIDHGRLSQRAIPIAMQITATRVTKRSLRRRSVRGDLGAMDKKKFSHTVLRGKRKKKLCAEGTETQRREEN